MNPLLSLSFSCSLSVLISFHLFSLHGNVDFYTFLSGKDTSLLLFFFSPSPFLSLFLSFWELKSELNGVMLGFPTDKTVLRSKWSSLPVEYSCFEWKGSVNMIGPKNLLLECKQSLMISLAFLCIFSPLNNNTKRWHPKLAWFLDCVTLLFINDF